MKYFLFGFKIYVKYKKIFTLSIIFLSLKGAGPVVTACSLEILMSLLKSKLFFDSNN